MSSSSKFSTGDQKAFRKKNPTGEDYSKKHFDGVGEVTCNSHARQTIGSSFKTKLLGVAEFKKTSCYNL